MISGKEPRLQRPAGCRSCAPQVVGSILIVLLGGTASACGSAFASPSQQPSRIYAISFESIDDFKGFYIVPQNHLGTASHELTEEKTHSGRFSHKGWITAANAPGSILQAQNHRAYPAIQLYKQPQGAFQTPVYIELWVWAKVELARGEWFSLATLGYTRADEWDAVLVNINDEGFVHLMHVPYNGQGRRTFQTATRRFPMAEWVKLGICLHFDRESGYARVWQNDELVSSADVRRGKGEFTQAHFGLYAPPSLSQGVIYNDDLRIREGGCP